MSPRPLPELDDDNFDREVFEQDTPMLVECYSESSYAARELDGILQQLADKYGDQVRMARLDIDAHWQTAEALNVARAPCVLAVQNRRVVDRIDGARTRAEYEQEIHELIARHWVI